MQSLNEVTILGRIGNDPTKAMTSTGKPSMRLSICTNEKFTANGETKETQDWHDAIAFGNIATMLDRFGVRKGQEILIVGKLKHYCKEYQPQVGPSQKTWHTYIQVVDVKVFGFPNPAQAPANQPERPTFNTEPQPGEDEDLPF